MKSENKTMAELLAIHATDLHFEDAGSAVDSLAEDLAEDFCPNIDITRADYEKIKKCYTEVLENYICDADALLAEWAESTREEQETREDALRSAYGTC